MFQDLKTDQEDNDGDRGSGGTSLKKSTVGLTSEQTYEDLMATIFAFFGITDYVTAQRMTLKEFNIRQRARDMQMLDEEKRVYLLAFQIRQAQASKKDGKYIFEKFEDFYNEEERRRTVLNRSQGPAVNQELIEIAKRLQKRRKEGGIDG
nr:MAG TPA: hypothetical protein [Caudoviricetes sp.]